MKELESVVLATDLPEKGLKRGDIGTIVLVHSGDKGYEVEFMTLDGETVAVVSLSPSQIRRIGPKEIAHVRPVERLSA
jgi:ATP-dependent exoDNAse (exonuclease V) alpha subunit